MLEIIFRGGLIMWVLLGIAFVGGVLFLERLFHLHRAQISATDFLEGIYNVLRRRNVVEAISICEETPGPVSHIMRAAILHGDADREEIRHAIEAAGLAEVPRLERNLALLATLTQLAPVLGLLGTIIGMMETLSTIQQQAPLIHAGDLGAGLWQALITTAAGLAVAVPLYAGYNFLLHRVESILLDMERASVDILNFLSKPAVKVEVDA